MIVLNNHIKENSFPSIKLYKKVDCKYIQRISHTNLIIILYKLLEISQWNGGHFEEIYEYYLS